MSGINPWTWGKTAFPPTPHANRSKALSPATGLLWKERIHIIKQTNMAYFRMGTWITVSLAKLECWSKICCRWKSMMFFFVIITSVTFNRMQQTACLMIWEGSQNLALVTKYPEEGGTFCPFCFPQFNVILHLPNHTNHPCKAFPSGMKK